MKFNITQRFICLFVTHLLILSSPLGAVTGDFLYKHRPKQLQEKIDQQFNRLIGLTPADQWNCVGDWGFYNLMGFRDSDVIAQRIERAPLEKKHLYFMDLGSAEFAWVDKVSEFLELNYPANPHHFHVIGVTGEGTSKLDQIVTKGNVTSYKLNAFKLENMLESFEQRLGIDLLNSVEFVTIVTTLQHLVDPIGTLDQAYHLLSYENGFIFASGFYDPLALAISMDWALRLAFGASNYIVMEKDRFYPPYNAFALSRPNRQEQTTSLALANLAYDETIGVHTVRVNSASSHFAQLIPKKDVPKGTEPQNFGGKFFGLSLNVFGKLIGRTPKLVLEEGQLVAKDLFISNSLKYFKLYLDGPHDCNGKPLYFYATERIPLSSELKTEKKSSQCPYCGY